MNKKASFVYMKKEILLLRSFAVASAAGVLLLSNLAFKNNGPQQFDEITVHRINIVEPDGTVKMVITNADKFPNGQTPVNGRTLTQDRKKRSGMLYFNEDGVECGGFIYDGKKKAEGHSAGMSLTYDQYDGDQVMQLLTTDEKTKGRRYVSSSLVFNERPVNESMATVAKINDEINQLAKTSESAAQKKYDEYKAQGLIGATPRIMLGKSRSENNGLFLFDSKGMPRAMFYIDKNNNAQLDFLDENGKSVFSLPKK
jgi:hypothetical protein